MIHDEKAAEENLPSKDIVLGALNNDAESIKLLLQFYYPYVKRAASFPVFDESGHREGTFVCDDLIQEMQITIVHVIDVLRVKLSSH